MFGIVTHKLVKWLQSCPHLENLAVESLAPGPGAGLYPKGVVSVKGDILGNRRTVCRYLLLKRGVPGDGWQDRFCAWALDTPAPEGWKISIEGGSLCKPTDQGWGTWEITLFVEFKEE